MADVNGVDAGSRVEIFDGTTEVARFEAGAVDVTGTITTDGLTSSAAITSTSNSNSLGGTTFTSAISGTTASMSGSITISGNSNTFGSSTITGNLSVDGGTIKLDGLSYGYK
jgi:hypothetical protein